MTLATLHSSERHDWQTPECVLERVRRVAPIAIDPCTSASNPTGAERAFTVEEDGLAQSWGLHLLGLDGLVYVNPPYGRELPKWVNKSWSEALEGVEVVLLAPARTDTKWFARASSSANARAFWRGRLTFVGAPHPAPFPSALWYWGDRPWDFCAAFADVAEVQVLR